MASEFIKRQKDDFFRDLTVFGSLWFYIFIALVFLIQKNYGVLKKLMAGFVLIYIIVVAIRSFYFKNRPKKYSYNSYLEKLDAASFPSLHSSRAVYLSMILMNFFNNTIFSAFIAILVVIASYSRIYLKKHDLKDVSAGFAVGILAYFVVDYLLV